MLRQRLSSSPNHLRVRRRFDDAEVQQVDINVSEITGLAAALALVVTAIGKAVAIVIWACRRR